MPWGTHCEDSGEIWFCYDDTAFYFRWHHSVLCTFENKWRYDGGVSLFQSERRRRRYRNSDEDISKPSKVFVQIQKLGPKDTFVSGNIVYRCSGVQNEKILYSKHGD